MIFEATVAGIPCQIKVENYIPGQDAKCYGSELYDWCPPEPEEIEFTVLDRKGYVANWLQKKLTEDDEIEILTKYKELIRGH